MKFSIVALSLFAALATAQDSSGLPTCAQNCVGSSLGGCNPLDIKCICSNKSFITNISCCIAGKCNEADQKATIKFANQICAGVQVTLPQQAACSATGSGSKTGSGTAASASRSSAVASSTPLVSQSSSASITANPSSTNTAASVVSLAPSQSASRANNPESAATTSGSTPASSSSAAPASQSTAAAPQVGVDSAMGVAGLAAAVFAFL